jgi:site-specific DNA-methyltransferase (adenine-specific)
MVSKNNQLKIDLIKPYPRNSKVHSKKQIDLIAKSIKEFGFKQPIVVDKNNEVIIGHARLEAAKQLGLKEVPTIDASDLTDKQVKALRLADNKLAELATWDMNLAIEELKGLDDLIDLTGFDRDLLIEPDAKDDVIPDSAPTRAKKGDIWALGRHRVMCGDSTKREDVERLMDGKKADMSFTSPPYNVGHNLGYDKKSKYENSDDNLDNYVGLIVESTKLSLECANEVFVNIQFLANNKKDILLWLAELSDRFKDIFFWKKLQVAPQFAERVANTQTEIIVLFGHNNNRAWGNKRWRGNFSNTLETKSASGENENAKIHNATFPVELPLKFITQGYDENSIILDLFIGTGTTLIACEKTNRICFGMEIDEKYCDVILKRYEDYTNTKAKKVNE